MRLHRSGCGELLLQSEEGKGSTFYFTIELEINENAKLYINDRKAEIEGKQKASQAATVRTYVVKEAEYTLVVVATRST